MANKTKRREQDQRIKGDVFLPGCVETPLKLVPVGGVLKGLMALNIHKLALIMCLHTYTLTHTCVPEHSTLNPSRCRQLSDVSPQAQKVTVVLPVYCVFVRIQHRISVCLKWQVCLGSLLSPLLAVSSAHVPVLSSKKTSHKPLFHVRRVPQQDV